MKYNLYPYIRELLYYKKYYSLSFTKFMIHNA